MGIFRSFFGRKPTARPENWTPAELSLSSIGKRVRAEPAQTMVPEYRRSTRPDNGLRLAPEQAVAQDEPGPTHWLQTAWFHPGQNSCRP